MNVTCNDGIKTRALLGLLSFLTLLYLSSLSPIVVSRMAYLSLLPYPFCLPSKASALTQGTHSTLSCPCPICFLDRCQDWTRERKEDLGGGGVANHTIVAGPLAWLGFVRTV